MRVCAQFVGPSVGGRDHHEAVGEEPAEEPAHHKGIGHIGHLLFRVGFEQVFVLFSAGGPAPHEGVSHVGHQKREYVLLLCGLRLESGLVSSMAFRSGASRGRLPGRFSATDTIGWVFFIARCATWNGACIGSGLSWEVGSSRGRRIVW